MGLGPSPFTEERDFSGLSAVSETEKNLFLKALLPRMRFGSEYPERI